MKQYLFIILSIVMFAISSCNDWLDVNDDPDSPDPSTVNENVLLPGIMTTVVYELTGGFPARWPNYWVGQITVSEDAPSEATFDIDESDVNNTWTYTVYTSALKNTRLLMDKAQANGNFHYLGIAQVLAAYTLGVTTDLWGDIPWTQAFNKEQYPNPVFDTQETIYAEIMRLLNSAVVNFNKGEAGQGLLPGNDDYIYGGDVAQWVKLANTLKARFAIHLTYAPGRSGAAQADTALAALANGLKSNADNPEFPFQDKTDAENPWYQWRSKWVNQLYANSFIVNLMKQRNDPRLSAYFTLPKGGVYRGHRNGKTIPLNVADSISQYNTELYAADRSVPIITYFEAKFIQAEALLWKGNPTAARDTLISAIRASFNYYDVTDAGQVNPFINAIAMESFANFETAQRLIIEQKYIANILSVENWNDYRRTGYPQVSAADVDNPSHNNIPLRFMYGSDTKLISEGQAPDVNWLTDPIWWDKK